MANTPADDALVLYRSERFRGWLMVLIGNVARDVYVEATATPNHVARMALARVALANPAQHVDRFVNALIGDVEVSALGGLSEEEWTSAHLVQLRAKVVQLWTPLAVDMFFQ